VKQRMKSSVLKKLEAVIPRLAPNFARLSDIEYELAREIKGYSGEKRVDYFLDELSGRYSILRGVCLRSQGKKFQIDTLIITGNAIYIVEIKNLSGTITFDTTLNQFIRDDGEKETGYRHPITQAQLQQLRLESWLRDWNLKNPPIYYFIAISDPATIIKVVGDSSYIGRLVSHGEHIPGKILEKESEIARNGGAKIKHIALGKAITQAGEEYDYNILKKFGVKEEDIRPGVQCPTCSTLGMVRQYGIWHCPKCQTQSKNAHSKTLSDFLLLIKPSISNKECQFFLNVDSRATVTRILQQSGLIYEPKTRRWKKQFLDGIPISQ